MSAQFCSKVVAPGTESMSRNRRLLINTERQILRRRPLKTPRESVSAWIYKKGWLHNSRRGIPPTLLHLLRRARRSTSYNSMHKLFLYIFTTGVIHIHLCNTLSTQHEPPSLDDLVIAAASKSCFYF